MTIIKINKIIKIAVKIEYHWIYWYKYLEHWKKWL